MVHFEGERLSVNVTRKLAAIVYADVAGYSRLTGADEEGTHRILSVYLDAITACVESHGGANQPHRHSKRY